MPYKDAAARSAYQAGYASALRRAWLETHGPCAACGSADDLEVDHVERREKVSHRIWSWSRERREDELAKCQVLCRRCHLEKTREENARPMEHGTISGYRYRGCRCAECREAQRVACAADRQGRNTTGETRTPDLIIMSDAL